MSMLAGVLAPYDAEIGIVPPGQVDGLSGRPLSHTMESPSTCELPIWFHLWTGSLDGGFLLVPPYEDVRKDLSSLEVCWAQSSAMSWQMERATRKNGATRKPAGPSLSKRPSQRADHLLAIPKNTNPVLFHSGMSVPGVVPRVRIRHAPCYSARISVKHES
jgi:hypothetical protein